jgi:hypothetical protein
MKELLRTPLVRLVLVVTALGIALFALRLFTSASGEDDAVPLESVADVPEPQPISVQTEVPVAPVALTLDDLGAPDDPLPAPFSLPAIELSTQADEAAETLAREVLAGTANALPALIAALQASGIGIIGPGNSVDAKPAAPWQGLIMQRWEVRTSAAMVLPGRTVTFTLADLAAFLVAVIPELKGAAVEQLIVTDLRGLADSQVPTRRFFGQFMAALGRNANSGRPSDLFGGADPQTIQVNGLQASLILRRLSIDILMSTADAKGVSGAVDKKAASLFDTLEAWLSPAVYAQGQPPCRLSESTQTIMDIAALGSSLLWGGVEVGELGTPAIMQRLGLGKLGNAAAIASTLLAYAQFIAAYAALEVTTTLDVPPLVRTKKRSPQTGERKQLTAIVKMNIGNAQMLNCFRAMLIAVGLDFSIPNDGPVKGAHVLWYGVDGFDQAAATLHGGSEAIVQFVAPEASRVQGSGSASASPVTDAVTGDDGKVEMGVEGRGQRENVSNDARKINKSATVRLQVALKGADLFGDVSEAAGTAAGGLIGLATLPLSVLQRAQWASAGHYRFPVIDWKDGPAQWAGTISVVETTISGSSGTAAFNRGAHEISETETQQINVQVNGTEDDSVGGAYVSLPGTVQARYDQLKTHAGWTLDSCGQVKNRQMKNTSRESSAGSASGEAAVAVVLSEDGAYQVAANIEKVKVLVEGRFSGSLDVFRQECAVFVKTDSRDHVPTDRMLGGLIQVSGKIDPSNPNLLKGSISEEIPQTVTTPGARYRRVKTTTWELKRS